MRHRIAVPVVVLALVAGVAMMNVSLAAPEGLTRRAVVPHISNADPTQAPTPTPTPMPRKDPYVGPIASLYLGSAQVLGGAPIEERDTYFSGGREYFDDPSAPQYVTWYPRFGRPGWAAGNTILAAHVNYVGHGNGPFAYLLDAAAGDALHVTMANGDLLTYTVKSVVLYHLSELDMDAVVFPALDSHTERVTLISCGGTFIPAAIGGEYDSRIVLVAERFVP
ncbi:MAG: class F sortase [Dehalococcoidia bacterium]